MKSKFFLFFLFLLFCTPHLQAQKQKISVALGYIPHVQFAPFYIADKYGYFEKENLQVNLQYTDTSDAMTLLARKKIDIALADTDALISARARGLPLKAFFQYYQKLPVCIFTTDPNINTASKLEGKTIGVPELYGASYLSLLLFLQHYNLTDKVKILRVGYEQTALLISKKIDAAVGYQNNEPVYFLHQKRPFKSWNTADFAPLLAGSALIADENIIKENPRMLRRFSRAMQNAVNKIMNEPDECFKELESYLNIRENQRELMYKIFMATVRQCFSADTNPASASYEFTLNCMKDLDLLGKDITVDELIAQNIR